MAASPRSMRTAGYSVFASDIEPRGEGIEHAATFCANEPPHLGSVTAVTNSPFGKHLTLFITRGLPDCSIKGPHRPKGLVLLVRHDALMAQERVDAFNRAASESCTATGARCVDHQAAAATPAGPALEAHLAPQPLRPHCSCVAPCTWNRSGGEASPCAHSTRSFVPQHTRSNTMPRDNTNPQAQLPQRRMVHPRDRR